MNNLELHNPHLDGSPFSWKAGPVGVLLFHGFTATTVDVRPIAERLREKNVTTVGPLLPGHGTSPKQLNRTRWRSWLKTAEAEYKKISQDCPHVFVAGESMGAVLALNLATRHPEIAGVIAMAPAIRLTLTPFQQFKLALAAPFVEQVKRDSLDCEDAWQGYPGLPLKGVRQLLALQRNTHARLPIIRQPLLVFQGRLDTTVDPAAGDILMNGVTSEEREHVWLEHSSHAIPLDQELDLVMEHILAFMERCVPDFAG